MPGPGTGPRPCGWETLFYSNPQNASCPVLFPRFQPGDSTICPWNETLSSSVASLSLSKRKLHFSIWNKLAQVIMLLICILEYPQFRSRKGHRLSCGFCGFPQSHTHTTHTHTHTHTTHTNTHHTQTHTHKFRHPTLNNARTASCHILSNSLLLVTVQALPKRARPDGDPHSPFSRWRPKRPSFWSYGIKNP